MYRLCTGKMPFSGPNVMAVLMALGTKDPTPVRELNPNVPEALAALIYQLLAKNAGDRPQTATDVAKRLRAILEQLVAPTASAPSATAVEATPADLSTSMPMIINAVPVQPPAVSQMHITAQPESDAKNPDVTPIEPTFEKTTKPKRTFEPKPKPARKKSGKKGLLIAAGVALLLAVGVGVGVLAMMNKGKPEPEVKAPEVPKPPEVPGDKSVKPVPKVEPKPTDPFPPTYKNGTGIEFVKVPKAADQLDGGAEKVTFDYDFYLGKFELTQEEWEKVMGTNPSWFSRTGKSKDMVKNITDADLKRFPVENVSWDDCQEFLKKLNEKEKETGWVYRLPTSAEWGYACRGGPVDKPDTLFKFYFAKPTNTLLLTQANFQTAAEAGLGRPCPVGSYPPNRLGLHDMHGNVWEWCHDTVHQQGTSYRTTTSGGWVNEADACQVENRYLSEPSSRSYLNGFRVARVPVGKTVEPVTPVGPPTTAYKNGTGIEFVKVPKGTGWLGGGADKEGQSKVVFEQDFYLGKYEVTQEEWEKVMGANPSGYSRKGDHKGEVTDISDANLKRFPVEYVSWNDCQAFLKKLNEKEKETGWVYRLPTSAEWEYACRGGPVDKAASAFNFYFAKPTNTLLQSQANFGRDFGSTVVPKRTCKVGMYEPNVLGLHDMHGNVWEWCDDIVKSPDGLSPLRMMGGSWENGDAMCQASSAGAPKPEFFNSRLGLRVARVPATKDGPVGVADPDRKAAEWVRSVGGQAGVTENPFKLTSVNLFQKDAITDADLACFRDCKNLTHLDLGNCAKITDAGLAHFTDLQNLTYLSLLNTQTSDVSLTRFKECKTLTHLDLSGTQVTNVGLAYFKDCKKLEQLRLDSSRQWSDEGLVNFKDCPNLTHLYLSHTKVTDVGLVNFKGCKKLEQFTMNSTSVTGTALVHFKDCMGLKHLGLFTTQVDDVGLAHLKECKSLSSLYLTGAKVTAEKVAELQKALPNCKIEWTASKP